MTTTKKILAEINKISKGEVFTITDFKHTDVEYVRLRDILHQLATEGIIKKIDGTTYTRSKVGAFGIEMPTDERKILNNMLKEKKDSWMLGGEALFHKYGLTTQNPILITILNNKSTYNKKITDNVSGTGVNLKLKKISVPINQFNKKIIEILEIIKYKNKMYGVSEQEVNDWLLKQVEFLKPRMIVMLTSLGTKYYPKSVSITIISLLEKVLKKDESPTETKNSIHKSMQKLNNNLKTKKKW